jgi:hypothetical protein
MFLCFLFHVYLCCSCFSSLSNLVNEVDGAKSSSLSRCAWLRFLEVGTGCVPTHVSLVYMHTHSCVLQERKCGPTSSNLLLLLLLFHSLKNGAFLPRFLPLMNGERESSVISLSVSLSFVDKKKKKLLHQILSLIVEQRDYVTSVSPLHI